MKGTTVLKVKTRGGGGVGCADRDPPSVPSLLPPCLKDQKQAGAQHAWHSTGCDGSLRCLSQRCCFVDLGYIWMLYQVQHLGNTFYFYHYNQAHKGGVIMAVG